VRQQPTIFFSSTWADLERHREVVLFTLAKLRRWVEAMEYFGAMPGEPLQECLASVRRSDVYVVAVGTRYGHKDSAGISITQREYEQAYNDQKRILAYLIDEDHHPVLPKFFDTGEDARKLRDFKQLLKTRHTCAFFSSPEDLAVRIGVDLMRILDADGDASKSSRVQQFSSEMPILLAEAGYGVGMSQHVLVLSDILAIDPQNQIVISEAAMKEIVAAGYLAVNLSRGNCSVLKEILTFDLGFWRLLITLVRHYGVPAGVLGAAITACRDPVQFRLLTRLSGELRLVECAEAICRTSLFNLGKLKRRFSELREDRVTPLEDVVRSALCAMPAAALPIIEKYEHEAKVRKRWQQKRIFEAAIVTIRHGEAARSSERVWNG